MASHEIFHQGRPVAVDGALREAGQLEIRLIGGMRCHYQGSRIELGGVLPKSLLAALVLNSGQTLVKDTVIEALWGPDPPLTAERLIADYLSRLRTALAPAGSAIRLRAMRPGFRAELDPDLAWADIHRFRGLLDQAQAAGDIGDPDHAAGRLEHALALWPEGAEPLADLESAWLRGQARALSGLRLTAVERLARLHLDAGRPQQARQVLSGTSPAMDRENLTAVTIDALAATGESSRAVDLARSARDKLAARGKQPGQALQAALDTVLGGAASPGRAERGPRHLLRDTALFTGRNYEMDALLALAGQVGSGDSPGAVVISAIDGMGGVGKTALALHAAHRLGDRFPDGNLFIDLAGFTAGRQPTSPSQALAELLRILGIPPQLIPEALDARAAFYRDRLHGTRTLIVLDNAASENQVRPLLPGTSGCLVLITSRKRLSALDDALPLRLDALAPADAVALLRRAARLPLTPASHRDDEADRLLEQVAGLCGHLPLALLIAAALLRAHGRAWTLRHLIDRLATRSPGRELARFDDGTRNLTAVFDVSCHALTPAQQQFYRRLGMLPGPEIDAYAAAALLDSDLEQAEELLEQLAGHSLLEAASPGRYRMHDLLRAHARTLAAADSDDQRQAARARLFRYYQHTARHAATLTTLIPRPGPGSPAPAHAPPLPDAETAWAWLRAERANLQAATDHAERHDLGQDLVALAAGLATVLHTDGPWSQATVLHETAAATADRLGDRHGQAYALTDLGAVRWLTGDCPGATDAATQALGLYRDLADRQGQANALANLGIVRQLTGDYSGAIDAATQALGLYRDLADRLGQAYALADLGRVRLLTGDCPGATDALTQALQTYCDLGNRHGQADALANLGRIRRLTGDFPGATDSATQALGLYRDLGNRLGQANALTILGMVRRVAGDFPGATDSATQALGLYRDLGNRHGQADALTELGRVRLLTGDCPGATDVLTQALQTYRDLNSPGDEGWALNYYAAAVMASGDVTRALELYRQALDMNRELGQPDDEAIALEGIGECLLAQGHTTEGTDHLREALALYQRLGMRADIERLTTRLTTLTDPPA